MNKKILISTLMAILLINLAFALTTYYETSSVSRIVGESPTEMLRQMQRNVIELDSATYFTTDTYSYDKFNILSKQFDGEVEGNMVTSSWSDSFSFHGIYNNVQPDINAFDKNELFILETTGEVDPLLAYSKAYDKLYPNDVRDWQDSFESNNPLFLFDSPYAGIYLPKQDTYVSRLVRDSTIIAPASFNSPDFVKSFLCQLERGMRIGDVFRLARIFHYGGGSRTSADNYIGLILQSYTLYGNPQQLILMDWYEGDKEQLKSNYCKNYLENLAPDIEFLGQYGNYSKFRKHVVLNIPSHNLVSIGNHTIINATPAYQNYEYGELVLPIASRTTQFPLNTIITNYSVDYVGDYVDLTVSDLPSFENAFVNRTCYYENMSYQIDFENAYSQFSQDIIAKIIPIEIINCTSGEFRLYKQFNYSIDYVPLSPLLIKNINAPSSNPINEPVEVKIETLQLTNDTISGSLAILNKNNTILWIKEINTSEEFHNASFYAPTNEGLQTYSVEFIIDNQTLNYQEFSVNINILEPIEYIPITTSLSPTIWINFKSYYLNNFDLDAYYYLIHDNDIVTEGNFTKNLAIGDNNHSLAFTGLTRENQTYKLLIEMDYLGNRRAITYLLNTNNVPFIYANYHPYYYEGQLVEINYSVLDLDNDSVIISTNDSRFTQQNDSFIWQTLPGDKGNYSLQIYADDTVSITSTTLHLEVKEYIPLELYTIYNITTYEGYRVSVIPFAVSVLPEINYSINDSRFVYVGNDTYEWSTQENESRNYTFEYSATDGINISSRTFNVELSIYDPPCMPLWNCTSWSNCTSGNQTRTCIDMNTCNSTFNKPDELRQCSSILEIDTFSDGTLQKDFNNGTIAYIKVPKTAVIKSATLNLTGGSS